MDNNHLSVNQSHINTDAAGRRLLHIIGGNRFRRNNPALQGFLNLRFLDCANPNILAYAKISADRTNIVIIIVNIDPHSAHEETVELPLGEFGLTARSEFSLEEAFTRRAVSCRGPHQRFHLDPETSPALVFRLLPARNT